MYVRNGSVQLTSDHANAARVYTYTNVCICVVTLQRERACKGVSCSAGIFIEQIVHKLFTSRPSPAEPSRPKNGDPTQHTCPATAAARQFDSAPPRARGHGLRNEILRNCPSSTRTRRKRLFRFALRRRRRPRRPVSENNKDISIRTVARARLRVRTCMRACVRSRSRSVRATLKKREVS